MGLSGDGEAQESEEGAEGLADARREYAEMLERTGVVTHNTSTFGSGDVTVKDINNKEHENGDESDDEAPAALAQLNKESRRWGSSPPLLLVEECGSEIKQSRLSLDDRTECFSMLLRLHRANIIHRSFHARNILSQPGPLTKPPHKRSMKTPSFRAIDFGRSYTLQQDMAIARKNIGERIAILEGRLSPDNRVCMKQEHDKEMKAQEAASEDKRSAGIQRRPKLLKK